MMINRQKPMIISIKSRTPMTNTVNRALKKISYNIRRVILRKIETEGGRALA